jgi:hypothetical protein
VIEHTAPRLLHTAAGILVAKQRVRLACGCSCWCGRLAPELERTAIHPRACSTDHEPLIARFCEDWQPNPAWDPVDVAIALSAAHGRANATRVEEAAGLV